MAQSKHSKVLDGLCRLCACVIGGYKKIVTECAEDIGKSFKINVYDDNEEVHPKFICRTCYSALLNIKKRGIHSSQVVATWKPHNESCEVCLKCNVKSVGGRPKKKKSPGRPAKIVSVSDMMNLDVSKSIPPDVEKAVAHVMNIKMLKSADKSVKLKSGSGPPITLLPVTAPLKDSTSVSKRTLRNRSKECQNVISMISGGSFEATTGQTSHMVKSFESKVRDDIISRIGASTVSVVSADSVAAMKGALNISWNKLRDIRRWLSNFNVKLASEKTARIEAAEMRGQGLVAEMAPLLVSKGKGKPMVLEAVPWCYIWNLVGHVLQRLDQLKDLGEIVMHPHMNNEIHIKIGGDHGGGSFKMCYESCNVTAPNSKENTIVFSIFEEKDSQSNLRTCLERFRTQINKLNSIKWQGHSLRVFMFGDYQYLGYMYGLSGSSARHSCLWCVSTSEENQLPPRSDMQPRTLETIKADFERFVMDGRNVKNAKFFNNVIDEVFFDIPVSQACIPGLHLTLGIVLKIFVLLEAFALSCDIELACKKAENAETYDDADSSFMEWIEHISKLKSEVLEIEAAFASVQDERNWAAISQDEPNLGDYDNLILEIELSLDQKSSEIDKHIASSKFDLSNGPCVKSLDSALKSFGVERQAYYGKCLVGNHCHKILKPANSEVLCMAIPEAIANETDDPLLRAKAVDQCGKFKILLGLYYSCDQVFNSACFLENDIIETLSCDIQEFMSYFRTNWPKERITPKMHILEAHVTDFVSMWNTGCGFYGEQGGEAIHQEFNKMSRDYQNINNKLDRLKYKMEMHMLATAPKAAKLRKPMKARHLKRKAT